MKVRQAKKIIARVLSEQIVWRSLGETNAFNMARILTCRDSTYTKALRVMQKHRIYLRVSSK